MHERLKRFPDGANDHGAISGLEHKPNPGIEKVDLPLARVDAGASVWSHTRNSPVLEIRRRLPHWPGAATALRCAIQPGAAKAVSEEADRFVLPASGGLNGSTH